MWKNTFKCKICDRPMPPRVYEAHLKKSHTPEEVEKVKTGEQITEHLENQKEINKKIQENTKELAEIYDSYKKPFDWGEVYPCHSCGEEYPAKAMPWHAKQAHGV